MNDDLKSQVIREIEDRHGTFTNELGVAEAADPDHPFHDELDWNPDTASHSYRLIQMGRLVRSVRVVYKPATPTSGPKTVRGFISLPNPDTPGRHYASVEKVAADPFLRQLALADMRRAFNTLKEKYGHFVEFVEMIDGERGAA